MPINSEVNVIQRPLGDDGARSLRSSAALKSAIDFCRSADVRIVAAKLHPVNVLLPLVYFLSKQPRGSVPDDQRASLRSLVYFLLFNGFLGGKSPHARVRYLREVIRANTGAVLPLEALLAEVARRQRQAATATTAEMLQWNTALALNIAQPVAAKDTLSWQEAAAGRSHSSRRPCTVPIYGDLVDDIGNLAYLARLRNIRKNADAPWDYFKDVSDTELRDDFLVDDRSLLAHERFNEFVEKRRVLILKRVREFLGDETRRTVSNGSLTRAGLEDLAD